MNRQFTALLMIAGLAALSGYAAVSGPYTADVYTLHLYHFDGSAADDNAAAAIDLTLGYGATVTAGSYPGFETALNTYEGSSDTGSNQPVAYSSEQTISRFTGADGAFTFEALVCPAVGIGAIPNHMQIISGEDDYGQTRGWQFRVTSSGWLEFIKLTGSQENFAVPLPTAGDHGWAAGQWYHAAVTYNGAAGTADNLKFYWTALDSGASEAALLGAFQMQNDLDGWAAIDFAVGNEARETSGENFEGLVDEARISSIARTAEAMLFVPGSPRAVILVPPADAAVQEGQAALFEVMFESQTPPAASWFKSDPAGDLELNAGDPDITVQVASLGGGQYRASVEIAGVFTPDSGSYFCRINNDSGLPRDSEPANLLVYGIVSRWTFDADTYSGGGFVDAVGGREARVEGTPLFVVGAGGTGEAVAVNSGGGWADVEAFDPTLGSGLLTISLWANWQEAGAGSGDLEAADFPDGNSLTVADGLRAGGQWQHFCVVYNGSRAKVYVNGVTAAEGPWSLPEDTAAVLTIGSAMGGAEAFNGFLDDLRIYNHALSDTQVADLFYEVTGQGVCILEYGAAYDLNGPAGQPDCRIDLYDLAAFAGQWVSRYDLDDFAEFAARWQTDGLYPE